MKNPKPNPVCLAFAKILTMAKHFFFPPECVFCGRIMEIGTISLICPDCKAQLSFVSEKFCCEKCGKPIVSHGKRRLCYFCAEGKSHHFDRIVSAFEYTQSVRESIVRYKVFGTEGYSKTYADFLSQLVLEYYPHLTFDFICCAPPHTKSSKKQGTDRMNLLCRALSVRLKIPFEKDLLIKTRKTAKQTTLNYLERLTNLKDSILADRPESVRGKTVLLIDDVCTTRATIMECSRALKAAGAKRVYALTIATTVKKNES